jgi:hypothetical protein
LATLGFGSVQAYAQRVGAYASFKKLASEDQWHDHSWVVFLYIYVHIPFDRVKPFGQQGDQKARQINPFFAEKWSKSPFFAENIGKNRHFLLKRGQND